MEDSSAGSLMKIWLVDIKLGDGFSDSDIVIDACVISCELDGGLTLYIGLFGLR
jgi:hypothetical protein